MSTEAVAWAFKQPIRSASMKFVLIALAECAHYKTGLIYPSLAHLGEIAPLDRKTIIAQIELLQAHGYLIDTGERTGKTKQIKVYRLSMETVPKTEPSQKRNSSDFSVKQSQKRNTEPSKEPSSSEDKSSSETASPKSGEIPSWVPAEQWQAFVKMRKTIRKPLTDHAVSLAIKKLGRLASEGHDPGDVLDQSTMNSWQDLFPIRGQSTHPPPTNPDSKLAELQRRYGTA